MSRSNPSLADRPRRLGMPLLRGWRQAGAIVTSWWHAAARTARLAIGIPDYDNYVEHVRRHHPEREAMSRDAFFVERMQARYGKGRSRCC